METPARRISDPQCWDAALIMGLGYTLIYGAMVLMQYLITIPPGNEESVKQLISNMTLIQMAIVGYFFGGSKSSETTNRALVVGKERTDNVLREVVQATVPATPEIKTENAQITAETATIVEGKQ